MSRSSTLDLARENLFTDMADLKNTLTAFDIDRVMKVRHMYMWRLSNPGESDRAFVEEFKRRFPDAGKTVAYDYMDVVSQLLPMLSEKTKDFHRWRYNEMILETYQGAKAKNDFKTMERAASSYAKNNRIDTDDVQKVPYHLLMVQPFVATNDPRVLGIEPIPNIDEKISAMIEKYTKETIDITDVEFEEADLEEDELFADYDDEE